MVESRQVNPTPLRNQQNSRTRSPYSTRRDFGTSGSVRPSRNVVEMSEVNLLFFSGTCKRKLTERHRTKEALALHSTVQLQHFWLNIGISTHSLRKTKSRLHQIGIGYIQNSRGGWTTDMTIADWHDIENFVASEVERFILGITLIWYTLWCQCYRRVCFEELPA